LSFGVICRQTTVPWWNRNKTQETADTHKLVPYD
jgi:hypothetical protein